MTLQHSITVAMSERTDWYVIPLNAQAEVIAKALPEMVEQLSWEMDWGGKVGDIPIWKAQSGLGVYHITTQGHGWKRHRDVDEKWLRTEMWHKQLLHQKRVMACFP